jgi:hypothetical protein
MDAAAISNGSKGSGFMVRTGSNLMSWRATLGVEGGATIFDFNDDLDRQIDEYRASHPGAGFEELWQAILAPYEGNVVHATITPKILESIALRTALIL